MQDHPAPARILGVVIDHLKDNVLPDLGGRAQFDMRVALSALQLVRRSLELSPASDSAEHARLQALLGETGDLVSLNRALCARIADGEMGLGATDLVRHLRITALEKLAVDQPGYPAYRRETGQ